MTTPRTPGVLTPFAERKEQWTLSECAEQCERVIDGALAECEDRLQRVLTNPAAVDTEEALLAREQLKKIAHQLEIMPQFVKAQAIKLNESFKLAKQAAREAHPQTEKQTHSTTREIARAYAFCLAHALVIKDSIHARLAADEEISLGDLDDPLENIDLDKVFAEQDNAKRRPRKPQTA